MSSGTEHPGKDARLVPWGTLGTDGADDRDGTGDTPEAWPGFLLGRCPVNAIPVGDPYDPRLAEYRALKDPVGRRLREASMDFFVIEGRLPLERLVASAYRIRSVVVAEHLVATLAGLLEQVDAPIYLVTKAVLEETVGFTLHRGVVATADRPAALGEADILHAASGAPMVVLEGSNDHENIGSLFRSAAALGAGGVLLDPSCADPLYRRSVRVSMGHVLHVPFGRFDSWPDGLDALKTAGYVVVALAPHVRGAVDLADLVPALAGRPVALMIGAEGPGLTGAALASADLAVTIPMAPGVDSLNMATAAAIALYEVTRRPG